MPTRINAKRPWCSLTSSYDKDKLFGYTGGRTRKTTQANVTIIFISSSIATVVAFLFACLFVFASVR